MRQIGTLPTKDEARRFADYLLTQGVEVKTEENAEGWVIWVRDENQLPHAREELDQFEKNPADQRYETAARQAAAIRRNETVRREHARRNLHDMGDRWSRPLMQRRPLTVVLIALSIFVTALSIRSVNVLSVGSFNDFDMQWSFAGHFTFVRVRVNERGEAVHPVNGWQSIQEGQLWRLVTPIFLHLGFLHILFNGYWLAVLGGAVEERRGTLRYGLLVLAIAILSNVAEFAYSGNPLFGGLSGVVYGLFGYVWMKSLFDPRSGLMLDSTTVVIMVGWLLLCMSGAVGNIANTAHVAGLLTGMACGYVPIILRMSKR